MKELIEEFGESIIYGFIGIICMVLLLVYSGVVVRDSDVVIKEETYNSDTYSESESPVLKISDQVVIVEQNSSGYEADEIATTLSNIGAYTTLNTNEVKVKGVVDTSKEGTYNVKIIASNDYGRSEDNIAVIVNNINHSY